MPQPFKTPIHGFSLGLSSRAINLLAALLLVFSGLIHAEVLVGQVVGVSDGDTITLLDRNNTRHKIRLSGIDAPEKAQPFGQASKKSLSDLVYYKQVLVSWQKKDRYQRIIGKISLEVAFPQISRQI